MFVWKSTYRALEERLARSEYLAGVRMLERDQAQRAADKAETQNRFLEALLKQAHFRDPVTNRILPKGQRP